MTGMMVAIFWFLVWKPQRKREQERQAMIEKLKKNDRVLTTGGIYGYVHSVRDNVVVLKVDEDSDVKLRVAKSAISLVETGAEGGGEVKK
jgi:preprotein translocase subunit YajC